MWLFSFFEYGIRGKDLCLLTDEHIAKGGLRKLQVKSDKEKNAALHPYAAKVATLYKKGRYIFGIGDGKEPTRGQRINWRVMANRHLKTIALLCGINKPMHMHCSRHSFAGQALDAEVDDRTIQVAMGISEASYKHYKGKMRPEKVDELMAPVFAKIKTK